MTALLRRTPGLHAAWLEWTGARRRMRVVLGLGAMIAAIALLIADAAGLRDAMASAITHPLLVFIGSLAFGSLSGAARRARRDARRTRDWTSALPVAPRDARRAEWLSTAATSMLVGLAATLLVVTLVAVGTPREATPDALTTLVALWLGLGIGVAIARLRRPSVALPPPPGSRYVPRVAPRDWRVPPSLAPLAAWPFREAFVRAQPRAASRAALPVLLLLPAGLSAAQASVVLAVATLLFAAVAQGAGTLAAVRSAVAWLAPAPASRTAVAFATARPALLVLTVTALAGGALVGWLGR
jgi:hypothetical protein